MINISHVLTFFLFFIFILQELCKELHRKIDVVDEARYDMEVKVAKNDQEVQSNQE